MIATPWLGLGLALSLLGAEPETETEPEDILDVHQVKKLKRLQDRVFPKLYGYKEAIPAQAMSDVRETVFGVLASAHKPDRPASDKLVDDLTARLGERVVTARLAHELVESSARLLAEETISREGLAALLEESKTRCANAGLSTDHRQELVEDIERLVRGSKRDQAYLDKREEDKAEAKKAAEEEEAREKEEKEKKAQRKTRQRRSTPRIGGAAS